VAGGDAVKPYAQVPPFYAQWGEDQWLATHFHVPDAGVFVDVGAGDGERGSNTLYFEKLGWRGLCIEADPRNHQPLRQRRCCAVETCAIAKTVGPAVFGMHARKPSWSGLQRRGTGYKEILVTCHPLGSLLDRWRIGEIDLLSIDVEGTELEVWDSFDHSRHSPSIVIIEFDDMGADRNPDTIRTRLGLTYEEIHRTPANLIMQHVDRPWRKRI
jgi:FkbM family methyltransferase